jgi:hypothetical protein
MAANGLLGQLLNNHLGGDRVREAIGLILCAALALTAIVAVAPLPAGDCARIAHASRQQWREGVEAGLEALARARSKRTQARGRINRVWQLGPECDAWQRAHAAADLCEDSVHLPIPQVRCSLVLDLSHDAEAA